MSSTGVHPSAVGPTPNLDPRRPNASTADSDMNSTKAQCGGSVGNDSYNGASTTTNTIGDANSNTNAPSTHSTNPNLTQSTTPSATSNTIGNDNTNIPSATHNTIPSATHTTPSTHSITPNVDHTTTPSATHTTPSTNSITPDATHTTPGATHGTTPSATHTTPSTTNTTANAATNTNATSTVTPSTITPNATNTTATDAPSNPDDQEYPEQRHAGAVGYGPNYGQGIGLGQKLTGLKETVKGKVSHNPELIQQGKERRTGELKHREDQHAMEEEDPFANPEQKKKEEKTDMKQIDSNK